MTCAVGFVGGLQLWLPSSDPQLAYVATGSGSLTWDLSCINIDTGELLLVERNPCSSWLGRASLLFGLVVHLLCRLVAAVLSVLTFTAVTLPPSTIEYLAPPPCAPLQYFIDERGTVTGCAQACVSLGLFLRFSRKASPGGWVAACPDIPFSSLNLQLIGAGGAEGTLRMDPLSQSGAKGDVAIHTCDAADTTAYVAYSRAARGVGVALAHDSRADIDGFVTNAGSEDRVDAVVVTAAHSDLVPVTPAGERLKTELAAARASLGCLHDEELHLASRTLADDVWVLRRVSASRGAEFFLHTPSWLPSGGAPRRLLAALRGLT